MLTYKKLKVCLFFTFIIQCGFTQTVQVKKETVRIKGENADAVATELEGNSTEVNAALIKYLKSFGKVKPSDGVLVLSDATIYGRAYKAPIYAGISEKGSTVQAWFGALEPEWSASDKASLYHELEKLTYDFGVKFYRDKIQVQIDESLQAQQAVEKQQQRLVNENKNLNTKLENNKRQKIQLEKFLEENKVEHETLLKRIDLNKKAQDSVAIAREQIKKVVEMHTTRQQKVK